MKFYLKTLVITFILLLLIFLTGKFLVLSLHKKSFKKFSAKVIEVIDGDTIKIETGEIVRLLGIDAPETNHPDLPYQTYGQEAKDYLRKRILNRTCVFEFDENNKYDIYNRILAFVYLDNNLINAEMVKNGYAYVYTKSKNIKTKEFLILENIARKSKKGLWGIINERKVQNE
jgi:micrococcal nuclease